MDLLPLNLIFGSFVFWVAAKLYIVHKLDLGSRVILPPILILHAGRHLGLMFLSPGATNPGLPPEFAYPAALGDLAAAVLALIALAAVTKEFRYANGIVWIFNIWGTVDLLSAIVLATVYQATPFMGATYWIPAFWVPALLVTHYITFLLLLKKWS